MGILMTLIGICSLITSATLGIFYAYFKVDILLTLAIVFGVIAYHFIMRLLVGLIYSKSMKNHADYNKWWFKVNKHEMSFYEKLKVKKWKGNVPTYDKTSFDLKTHSLEEIASTMCQSELVHETIIILSFLPIICGIWFHAWWAFIVTSVLSALFDYIFVIVQRYNRQRVIHLLQIKQRIVDKQK